MGIMGFLGKAVIGSLVVPVAIKGLKFAARTAIKGGAMAYTGKEVLAGRRQKGAALSAAADPEEIRQPVPPQGEHLPESTSSSMPMPPGRHS